ncbi:MAG: molybdate ABC transporter permease subunit [Betaproteobacteria bacterium]
MTGAGIWSIALFTIGVASLATIAMLPFGLGLAWLLARRRFPGRILVDTVVTLPLVMPPVATGLILLKLFGREGPIGRWLSRAGFDVVFTWKAVVLAMAVMGLPLFVRTARAGFEQVSRRYEDVAETLGASPRRVFFTISLPLASRSIAAGALLAFSRAVGEFGATIMIAGAIPGRTRTLAVAIFTLTEAGQDHQAMLLLALSVAIGFGAVLLTNVLSADRHDRAAV